MTPKGVSGGGESHKESTKDIKDRFTIETMRLVKRKRKRERKIEMAAALLFLIYA